MKYHQNYIYIFMTIWKTNRSQIKNNIRALSYLLSSQWKSNAQWSSKIWHVLRLHYIDVGYRIARGSSEVVVALDIHGVECVDYLTSSATTRGWICDIIMMKCVSERWFQANGISIFFHFFSLWFLVKSHSWCRLSDA